MFAALRGMLGYCFLVFIVRITGRRPGKQMTPMDFVLVFFCGGLTLTTMVGDDRSLTNALCEVMAVALMHFLISWLKQVSPAFGRVVDGTPLVLLEKGQLHSETMSKMRVQDDDIMAASRDKGLMSLDDIEYAVLERNGEISIMEPSKGA